MYDDKKGKLECCKTIQVKLLSFQECYNPVTSDGFCLPCKGHALESMWFNDKVCTRQKNNKITNPNEGKVSKRLLFHHSSQ